jgi:ABC transporter substrate binding protein
MASHIGRRKFLATLGGAAAWPLAARAQQPERMRRIGVLMNSTATDATWQSYFAAFVRGLHQLGWIEGQNLRINTRWSAGDAALARIYAAQLIGLTPDVILTSSTTNLTVIQQATSTVPVVFIQVSDPVAQGFVAAASDVGHGPSSSRGVTTSNRRTYCTLILPQSGGHLGADLNRSESQGAFPSNSRSFRRLM